MSAPTLREKLTALLPSKFIEWRVGPLNETKDQARAMPRIAVLALEDYLDEIVGPEGWEVRYRVLEAEVAGQRAASVVCGLGLFVNDRWVVKESSAAMPTGQESGAPVADPFKVAAAEAFVRAAAMWGIGRYLVGYRAPWATLRTPRSFEMAPVLPDHLLPENERGQRPAAASPAEEPAATKPPARAAQASVTPPASEKPAQNAEVADAPATAVQPAVETAEAKLEGTMPATESGIAGEPGDKLAEAMAGLDGKALEMAKNVLERAKAQTAPIAMLRNYLKGDSAKKLLNDEVRGLLTEELGKIEGTLQAAA